MDKQTDRLIVRIDFDLKTKFKQKCDINHSSISARLKYLILKDLNNKESLIG